VRTTFPLVSIETAGPAEVNLGQRAKYTVTVRNEGDAPANGLVVQATLPAGAELTEAVPQPDASEDSCLEFRLGDLAPKAVAKLQIELIPRQCGSVDLKTHASISTSASATIQVRRPEVAIEFSGPSEAIVGDTVKFKATITNTGDVLVENLSIAQLPGPREDGEVLTEAVLEPLQSRIERLRPGQSQQIEVPAVATSAGLMRANIKVKGADGLEAQAAAEVRVRQPALAIKTIGPESRAVQRSGGYVILVSNTGDAAAEGVVITASVPKGLEVVGIEKRSTFDKKTNTLTWSLAQVAAGTTESLKFQLKAVDEGDQKLQVAAVGARKLNAQTEHVIHVAGKADLSLTVDDTPGPIEVGSAATYTVHVKNCGAKTVQNIRVHCVLPRGLEIEPSSDHQLNGSTLDFTAIDSLAAGEERVLRLSTTGREAGDQLVRFSLQCDILSREISAETSTFFFKAEK
jgi:uncharacterized repeat protein (TIGR01451 family)